MTPNRNSHALALLRAGCSYGEASDRTGLTLEEVQTLWKENDMTKKKPKPKPPQAKPQSSSTQGGGTGNGPPPTRKKS